MKKTDRVRKLGAALALAFKSQYPMGARLRTRHYDSPEGTIIIVNGAPFFVHDDEVELNETPRLAKLIRARYDAGVAHAEVSNAPVARPALPEGAERPAGEPGVPALDSRRGEPQ